MLSAPQVLLYLCYLTIFPFPLTSLPFNFYINRHCQHAQGIYGEGEERHFPRIIHYIQSGLFSFLIGGRDTLVEWVHVDNLAHAHILAATRLREEGEGEGEGGGEREENMGEREEFGGKRKKERMRVRGRAFYISDWKPINQYAFMEPLVVGLGYASLVTWEAREGAG